jgi:hypothetical protein
MMGPLGRRALLSASGGAVVARSLLFSNGEGAPLSTGAQTAYIIVSILLVAFSGLCAGLTLGLL